MKITISTLFYLYGEYIISQATFPSYFLRKEDEILKVYTKNSACQKFRRTGAN
ncbi:hypothetical protein LL033_00865 [Clostridium estertheticum]|uniref:hypothetical protein n=1 Tax=Clostridium estertheticum TaxID=238834 RepID=UPI00209B1CFB|nr:hypothetical protein [Clostridium estertheticum]WAG55818.1 hypothetical protein LL033_00865 [Clostridium estertheticum]